MSSYVKRLKNPKTGKMQKAFCIDDYYGKHRYGYAFRKDGKDAGLEDWSNVWLNGLDYFKEEELR